MKKRFFAPFLAATLISTSAFAIADVEAGKNLGFGREPVSIILNLFAQGGLLSDQLSPGKPFQMQNVNFSFKGKMLTAVATYSRPITASERADTLDATAVVVKNYNDGVDFQQVKLIASNKSSNVWAKLYIVGNVSNPGPDNVVEYEIKQRDATHLVVSQLAHTEDKAVVQQLVKNARAVAQS